jgi:hypothetical protein
VAKAGKSYAKRGAVGKEGGQMKGEITGQLEGQGGCKGKRGAAVREKEGSYGSS